MGPAQGPPRPVPGSFQRKLLFLFLLAGGLWWLQVTGQAAASRESVRVVSWGLEGVLPCWPVLVHAYGYGYVYVFGTALLMGGTRAFAGHDARLMFALLGSMLTAGVVYALFPTTVAPVDVPVGSGLSGQLLTYLQTADPPFGVLPCRHAAGAALTAAAWDRWLITRRAWGRGLIRTTRALNILIALLVVLSPPVIGRGTLPGTLSGLLLAGILWTLTTLVLSRYARRRMPAGPPK